MVNQKPVVQEEKYTIIKDTREKNGWNFSPDEDCEKMELFALKTGDYSLAGMENTFAIERKGTTAELANNIWEKRFEKELVRLDEFKHAFIICEFTYDDIMMFPIGSTIPKSLWHKLRMTSKLMQSSLTRYMVQHNVKIIYAGKNGESVAKQIFRQVFKYGKKV